MQEKNLQKEKKKLIRGKIGKLKTMKDENIQGTKKELMIKKYGKKEGKRFK